MQASQTNENNDGVAAAQSGFAWEREASATAQPAPEACPVSVPSPTSSLEASRQFVALAPAPGLINSQTKDAPIASEKMDDAPVLAQPQTLPTDGIAPAKASRPLSADARPYYPRSSRPLSPEALPYFPQSYSNQSPELGIPFASTAAAATAPVPPYNAGTADILCPLPPYSGPGFPAHPMGSFGCGQAMMAHYLPRGGPCAHATPLGYVQPQYYEGPQGGGYIGAGACSFAMGYLPSCALVY